MKLIEDWTHRWWRFWSIRVMMVEGAAVTYIITYPDEWKALTQMVPQHWRPVATVALGMFVMAIKGSSRLVVQDKLTAREGAE